MKRFTYFMVMCVAYGAMGTAASAQGTNEKVKIGQPAPSFKNLPGVDGKDYSLSDIREGAKCTVIAITCNHCPISMAYEDRLIQFVKDYEPKGVKVVAINVNTDEEDNLAHMKVRALQKGFKFPYLFDESQKIGRELGAAVTPEFFLIDSKGNMVFTGAMDDSLTPTKVNKNYLRDAVDAVLAGKQVATSRVARTGCSIEYNQ